MRKSSKSRISNKGLQMIEMNKRRGFKTTPKNLFLGKIYLEQQK